MLNAEGHKYKQLASSRAAGGDSRQEKKHHVGGKLLQI